LTVPVVTKGEDKSLIKEVFIDNRTNWRKKHLKSITQNYSKAPHLDKFISLFEDAYAKEWERLIDLDMYFIRLLAGILELERKIVFSSELKSRGNRVSRLINICKELGAATFYEGESGKNYIDVKEFKNAGVKIKFQHYRHPVYNQLYGEFVPYLSTIDLIFNCGDKSLKILTCQNKNHEVVL
jgi:hypothetical protein